MKSLKLRTKKWIRAWTRLELVFHQLQACLCEKKKGKAKLELIRECWIIRQGQNAHEQLSSDT